MRCKINIFSPKRANVGVTFFLTVLRLCRYVACCRLFESPIVVCDTAFNFVFYIIGQIAEEVDAGALL